MVVCICCSTNCCTRARISFFLSTSTCSHGWIQQSVMRSPGKTCWTEPKCPGELTEVAQRSPSSSLQDIPGRDRRSQPETARRETSAQLMSNLLERPGGGRGDTEG